MRRVRCWKDGACRADHDTVSTNPDRYTAHFFKEVEEDGIRRPAWLAVVTIADLEIRKTVVDERTGETSSTVWTSRDIPTTMDAELRFLAVLRALEDEGYEFLTTRVADRRFEYIRF